ncbi:MAG: LrgB family protein [Gemmatimonadaceae bacterium]|nr:LrgB family protein [Gemmatimonadaceae bacterium]
MNAIGAAILWLAVTVAVYAGARQLHRRRRSAALNPALVSIAVLIAVLVVTRTPYRDYERGVTLLSFWLGPAIVALGAPLARQLPLVRRNALAVAVSMIAGAAVGIIIAVTVASLAGASPAVVRSLAPRSATTPIAMAIAARIGGIPALSAIVSIASGALGGTIGVAVLRILNIHSRLATGLALGGAAHGLGTARAADLGDVEGATAAMAMGVVGVLTAVFVGIGWW